MKLVNLRWDDKTMDDLTDSELEYIFNNSRIDCQHADQVHGCVDGH